MALSTTITPFSGWIMPNSFLLAKTQSKCNKTARIFNKKINCIANLSPSLTRTLAKVTPELRKLIKAQLSNELYKIKDEFSQKSEKLSNESKELAKESKELAKELINKSEEVMKSKLHITLLMRKNDLLNIRGVIEVIEEESRLTKPNYRRH